MKILLVGINAKFIHSNLAIHSLKAYVDHFFSEFFLQKQHTIESIDQNHINSNSIPTIKTLEFTINQSTDSILSSIKTENADVVCFSCYIWNIQKVEELITTFGILQPKLPIWLGGPEVSYQDSPISNQFPNVTQVIAGEGELQFLELVVDLVSDGYRTEKDLLEITKNQKGSIINQLPFVYHDLQLFENRIVYYESSRGCPYRCSYCLSSILHTVTYRDMEKVKTELLFFLKSRIKQVKFVDRTFNCNPDRAFEIWSFLKNNDNGITNFHFEIAADLLTKKEIDILKTVRPNLIQLEIGIQTTNENTLKEIRRNNDFEKVRTNSKELLQTNNVHLHLDLIAGLPYETLKSFKKSFDDVMDLQPHQLQLGFLKVLKGTYMETQKEDYQLKNRPYPPFEILENKWISYNELQELKLVEEMVESYYNSGMFVTSISYIASYFQSFYEMYLALGLTYRKVLGEITPNRNRLFEILLNFGITILSQVQKQETQITHSFNQVKQEKESKNTSFENEENSRLKEAGSQQITLFREKLIFDFYRKENIKQRPSWAGDETVSKEESRLFYEKEVEEKKYLKGYEIYDKRQLRSMTHLERLGGILFVFDYLHRDSILGLAKVIQIPPL